MIQFEQYQNIRYFNTGEGETIVLLHGFCEHAGLWIPLAEELSKNYQVIALDLLGHTPNITLPSQMRFNIDDMADQVVVLLDHLQVLQATVIGHSMGGYVALNMLKRYPDYLSALGLFHSTPLADDDEKKETRNRLIHLLREERKPQFIELQMSKLTDEEGWAKVGLQKQDEIFEMMLVTPTEGIIAALEAMRDREDTTDVLQGTPIPVLFLLGKKDSIIPVQTLQKAMTAPEYVCTNILSDVAHLGMIENPEACLMAIRDFMKVKTLWIHQRK